MIKNCCFVSIENFNKLQTKYDKKMSSLTGEISYELTKQKTDGMSSIIILSSRIWTDIFWFSIFQIIATKKENFDVAFQLERNKERKKERYKENSRRITIRMLRTFKKIASDYINAVLRTALIKRIAKLLMYIFLDGESILTEAQYQFTVFTLFHTMLMLAEVQ